MGGGAQEATVPRDAVGESDLNHLPPQKVKAQARHVYAKPQPPCAFHQFTQSEPILMIPRIEADGFLEAFESVGSQFLLRIFVFLVDGIHLGEIVESEIVEEAVVHHIRLQP